MLGYTALMYAAANNQNPVVATLLEPVPILRLGFSRRDRIDESCIE